MTPLDPRAPLVIDLARLERLVQSDFEGGQLAIDVIIRLATHARGVLQGFLSQSLRLRDGSQIDLVLGDHPIGLRARAFENAIGLPPSVLDDCLPIRKELICPVDRFREKLANLVDQVENLRPIDDARGRQRHRLRIFDENCQFVKSLLDIHVSLPRSIYIVSENFASRRRNTDSGTDPFTSPPNLATSLIRLDDR